MERSDSHIFHISRFRPTMDPQITRYWWALPAFGLPLKDLPWLATWDTFWTTPFVRFPLPPWKSSHWKTWHKRSMSVNLLLTHAIWSGLSRTRPPTPQAIGVAACSRPKNLAFRLVSLGDYAGEDSLPTCSPSHQFDLHVGPSDIIAPSWHTRRASIPTISLDALPTRSTLFRISDIHERHARGGLAAAINYSSNPIASRITTSTPQ
jgi:hypothetical protein